MRFLLSAFMTIAVPCVAFGQITDDVPQGPDFTITFDIEASNLIDEVRQLIGTCGVFANRSEAEQVVISGSRIDTSNGYTVVPDHVSRNGFLVEVDDQNHSVNQQVTVDLRTNQPDRVHWWRCQLQYILCSDDAAQAVTFTSEGADANTSSQCGVYSPNTPSNFMIEGPIVRP